MEALEAIRNRRSIRRYRTDPVDDKMLETVLEAARWAPSWSNTQCCRFIVVRDAALKTALADTMNKVTRNGEPASNPATRAIIDAPVVIVLCAQLGISGRFAGEFNTDKGDWYMFDIALAVENLALAAHSLGLGTVIVGAFDAPKAAELLGIPEGFAAVVMTPLGFPEREGKAPPRKELSEIVYNERFGEPIG